MHFNLIDCCRANSGRWQEPEVYVHPDWNEIEILWELMISFAENVMTCWQYLLSHDTVLKLVFG